MWKSLIPTKQLLIVNGDEFVKKPWETIEKVKSFFVKKTHNIHGVPLFKVQQFLNISQHISKENFKKNEKGFFCMVRLRYVCIFFLLFSDNSGLYFKWE